MPPRKQLNKSAKCAREPGRSEAALSEVEVKNILSSFKVCPCPKQELHDHRICTQFHCVKDQRRNPYETFYLLDDCVNKMEKMYHPVLYKTTLCKRHPACPFGRLCAHAHSQEQLRNRRDQELSYEYSGPIPTADQRSGRLLSDQIALPPYLERESYVQKCRDYWTLKGVSPTRISHPLSCQEEFMLQSKPLFVEMQRTAFEEGMALVEVTSVRARKSLLIVSAIDADLVLARILSLLSSHSSPHFCVETRTFQNDRCIQIASDVQQNQKGEDSHRLAEIDGNVVTVTALPTKDRSARDCISHFFRTVDLLIERQGLNKYISCGCCFEDFNLDQGVQCQNGHYYCSAGGNGCFAQAVSSQILELSTRATHDDTLHCPDCGDKYDDIVLTSNLPSEDWSRIKQTRLDAQVAKRTNELEKKFNDNLQERVQELFEKYGLASAKLKAKAQSMALHIRNTILNLSCPHCHTAYAEFDGCMALQCQHCEEHFCGYCHQRCNGGRGAHDHVRQCLMNETPNGSYYADPDTITDAQRRYRTRKLKQFIQKEKKDLQNAIVIELEKDLNDLGIHRNALFEFGDLQAVAQQMANDN